MPTRDELILSHLPQVEYLAKRQHARCPQVELDDLIQVGTIGLIQAVDRYDPSRGTLLKTLADHRIRGALLDYLRQIDPLPRNVRAFQKRRDALQRSRPDIDPHELAMLLGVPFKRYIRLTIAIQAAQPSRYP
jgi:RNA polymerase sigma factor FliA